MSRFLWGLDLSLACTGLTVFDLDTLKPIFVGSVATDHIRSKKANKHLYLNGIKLKHIFDWLEEMRKQYPPEIVTIERGLSRFNTATQVIYRVHGLVNLMFWDVPQEYYPPKEVKAIIYKGDATKAQVQKIIKNNYIDIEFVNEDESDSFAVALTYLIKNDLINFEKPVVDKSKKKKKKKVEIADESDEQGIDLAELTYRLYGEGSGFQDR